jgi:hypothetical protein
MSSRREEDSYGEFAGAAHYAGAVEAEAEAPDPRAGVERLLAAKAGYAPPIHAVANPSPMAYGEIFSAAASPVSGHAWTPPSSGPGAAAAAAAHAAAAPRARLGRGRVRAQADGLQVPAITRLQMDIAALKRAGEDVSWLEQEMLAADPAAFAEAPCNAQATDAQLCDLMGSTSFGEIEADAGFDFDLDVESVMASLHSDEPPAARRAAAAPAAAALELAPGAPVTYTDPRTGLPERATVDSVTPSQDGEPTVAVRLRSGAVRDTVAQHLRAAQ